MGKIVYLMGKSSSGKDTIYKHLLQKNTFSLKRIIPYTTRPIRDCEKEGEEYHYTNEEGFHFLLQSGKVIEHRAYHTFHGLWRYFMVDDGAIDLNRNSYICIGTLDAYKKTREYFGEDKLIPVMIELADGIRLRRALAREDQQVNPKYEEMCRRFLADSEDFSEQKIQEAGISKRFLNNNLEQCLSDINAYLEKQL